MFRQLRLLIWKDLRSELRRKEQVGGVLLFVLLATLILNFALPPAKEVKMWVPGIIWVIFVFAGTIGLNKAFTPEKENGCLAGLTLAVGPGMIFLSKAMTTVVLLLTVEAVTFPLIMLLFSYKPEGSLLLFAIVAFFVTTGFASIGVFIAALTSYTKNSELLLPVLLFPLLVPLVIGAVEISVALLNGQPAAEWLGWLKLVGAFDLIYLVVPWLLFDYLVEV
ncbi:heme exporter protein CcmB [Thermincola ferriacetica]